MRVFLFLAISPGSKYNRDEIKQKTEMNNVPLDASLNKLYALHLLNKEEKIYSLNLENNIVKILIDERRKIANLPLKIQFIILDAVENILRIRNIKGAILFGSYSKLIFHEKSDIDLAVILDDKIKISGEIERNISLSAKKISKKYKKDIQVHYFQESDIKHKEDPLIKDIMRNGISLI
jgi:predicted nucleotidyltransferase